MRPGEVRAAILWIVLTFCVVFASPPLEAASRTGEAPAVRLPLLSNGSPATHLGGVPEYGRASGDQWFPELAFGDGVALAVWEDGRWGATEVYAARVSGNEVLDPSGFPVGSGQDTQRFPACAFGGGSFLVVWQEGLDRIMARRVSPGGETLGAEPFVVCGGTDARSPAVASSDSHFLVVWHDIRGGETDVYGARVTFSGDVLDPGGFLICGERNEQTEVAVASDGTDFLVIWQDRRLANWSIYGSRVDASGGVLDVFGIPVCNLLDGNARTVPDVTYGGTSYAVLWQDGRNVQEKLFGTRVSVSGAVLDGTGVEVCSSPGGQYDPAVSCHADTLLAAWRDVSVFENVMVCRLDTLLAGGTAATLCTVGELEQAPSVCVAGGEWLVAWMDFRSGIDDDVYACRVSAGGTPQDPCGFLVSMTGNAQRNPRAAYGGANHLVVWEDYRAGHRDIYATRVSPSGEVMDTLGIAVASLFGNQYWADVSSNGSNFLVVWTDDRVPTDIYGHRVNSSGEVLEDQPIPVSTYDGMQGAPSVANDGATYFCVWEDYRDGNGDIYGARVSSSGLVLESSGLLVSVQGAEHSQTSPRVDFLDTTYVVVWEDDRNGDSDIYAARVTRQGEVLDSSGIRISSSPKPDMAPSVSCFGEECLVLWEERSSGPTDSDVRGARLNRSGELLDTSSVAVSQASGLQFEPDVASDVGGYLAVWTDTRCGNTDVYGTPLASAGDVVDPGGAGVSKSPDPEESPALSEQGGGAFLIVWSGVSGPPYEAYRIWGKLGAWSELTPAFPPVWELTAERVEEGVRLSWRALPGFFQRFDVQRRRQSQGSWETLASLPASGAGDYFWVDEEAAAVVPYYRLLCATTGGSLLVFEFGAVDAAGSAGRFHLGLPTPNPAVFPGEVTFDVEARTPVTVDVVNVRGAVVRRVYSGLPVSGGRLLSWDGRDWRGRDVAPGVYFLKLSSAMHTLTRKLVVLD
ncbi:MAG: hypothetical protein JSW03_08325 [Candidatus Eiseniibacteriota bacterium]|nr:MAG: hypothetical protein JSW03_08325 [Candidatus Eisenbacteria bacterium]